MGSSVAVPKRSTFTAFVTSLGRTTACQEKDPNVYDGRQASIPIQARTSRISKLATLMSRRSMGVWIGFLGRVHFHVS